ncbi:MAG: PAS domain S-box protein [Acidobacteriota bacterium]
MAHSASDDSNSVAKAGPGDLGDREPASGGRDHARHRLAEIAALAAAVGALMAVQEFLKQWLHADITLWESHVITILFSAAAAALGGYFILRRSDDLNARIVADADLSARVAAETAHTNALLRAVLESSPGGVLVAGLDGTILAFNRLFLTMWNVDEAMVRGPNRELMRHTTAQLTTPERLAASVARLRTDPASDSVDVLEFCDGRIIELLATPHRLGDVVVGRVWRCRDVTTNRRTQRQLAMLAHTVRSIAECVSITDMNDRLIFVNQAFLDTYGFAEAELLGQSIALVRSDKNTDEVTSRVLPETLAGGWRGELWNRRKDGTDFQILLSTSIVRDEVGIPVALVGVARDITEQKRIDEALHRGRESERIVTLAAGIAHEFNNLLQTVLASSSLALEDVPADNPAREALQSVMHAGGRAANLTSQLLAYAGRGGLARATRFDLNDEIREHARVLPTLTSLASTIDLDLTAASAWVRADSSQIRQVVSSLVTNAAEAMAGQAGRIVLRTQIEDIGASDSRRWVARERPMPGRYVLLSVEDGGVGIDAESITRIFDPFFSTKFLGRGMGLPAALGIARAGGGAISVDSTPGRGTCVTVALPYHPADA